MENLLIKLCMKIVYVNYIWFSLPHNKTNLKKVEYEMAGNAIASDFRSSKMAAGSHFMKNKIKVSY